MKDTLHDVHNILIEQLERLNDLTDKDENPLSPDLVQREFNRAKAVNSTAQSLVALNSLVLEAQKLKAPQERAQLPAQFNPKVV
jgi:hypothetical protein